MLRNSNPLEKDYFDFEILVQSVLSREQSLAKLRMDNTSDWGKELQNALDKKHMQLFADFLRCYNNKNVVPTLEAVMKMIEFHHNRGIDMLNLGCTLRNFANVCLIKSSDWKVHPFNETDTNLLEKVLEKMVGGPSKVLTREALVNETFIQNSTNLLKFIVEIDSSQLHVDSMCQPMPTGFHTRWEYESEIQRFRPRQNKSHSFENMFLSFFQRIWTDCKIESNVTTGRQKKIVCFSVDEVCNHCKIFLKLWDLTITIVFVKKHDLHWVMQIMKGEWRK